MKKGNTKIDRSCNVTVLPTSVCSVQCKDCYARRPEIFRPNVLSSRMAYLAFTKSESFVQETISAITKSKNEVTRLHESGDFYSEEYIQKWYEIATALPEHKFYTYTKANHLDFTKLDALPNFNVIRSITPIGLNYGNKEHVEKLQALGYKLCPCGVDKSITCMQDCTLCMSESKVCFIKH